MPDNTLLFAVCAVLLASFFTALHLAFEAFWGEEYINDEELARLCDNESDEADLENALVECWVKDSPSLSGFGNQNFVSVPRPARDRWR